MRKLYLSTEAKADLNAIVAYIATSSGSRHTATRFAGRLKARCMRLSRFPQIMGRPRPELSEGLRSVTEGNYVILFRYVGDDLEIMNIIEGHRDIEAMLGHDDDPDGR